jgi:hypothetical protein
MKDSGFSSAMSLKIRTEGELFIMRQLNPESFILYPLARWR